MQLSAVIIEANLPANAWCYVYAPQITKETSAAFAERFFSDDFYSFRGSARAVSGGTELALNFYGADSYIEGNTAAKLGNANTNALRFAVTYSNRSAPLIIQYCYSIEEEYTEKNSVTLQIEKSDDQRSYTAAVPNAENVKKIRLSTGTTGLTTIRISSLLAVSAYADSTEYAGRINSCVIKTAEKAAVIRGSVNTDNVVKHRDSVISVYILPHDRDSATGNSDTPIKTVPISTRFEIKIPLSFIDDLAGEKLYLTITNADGTEYPIAPARYADPAVTANGNVADSAYFKGIAGAGVADTAPGTVILDVDLSELFDAQNSGYAYRYSGKYYYFSREAADSLSADIMRYSAEGCRILLRLISGNPGKEVPYTFSFNESGVFCYALNASTKEARLALEAAVNYLSVGLCEKADCVPDGFIIGKNINNSGEYYFMGADYPLDQYAENYLLTLRTVYLAALTQNPDTKIYAGIGDDWANDSIGRKFLFPDYDIYLLLETLSARASAEGGVCFSVLLESDSGITSYTDNGADIFNLAKASDFIAELSERHKTVNAKPLLLWDPENSNALCADYAYLYYSAIFSEKAEAFAVDLSKVGSYAEGEKLVDLIKKADTVKTLVASAPYLVPLGVHAEGIYGFAPEKLVLKDVREYELLFSSPIEAKGSVVYRDFTQKRYIPEIIITNGCTVSGYGTMYTMCEFSSDPLQPNSILIDLEGTGELSASDILYLNLGCEFEGERTITLTVGGNGVIRNYSATAVSGRLRLYTSDAIPKKEAEYIKLTISGDGKLYLYEIGGESLTRSNAELQEDVHTLRGAAKEKSLSQRNWGIIVISIALLCSVSAVMMRRSSAPKHENDQ